MDPITAPLLSSVKEFMDATGQVITFPAQMGLVGEEVLELIEAAENLSRDPDIETMEAFLKEVADVLYVMSGCIIIGEAHQAAGGGAYEATPDDERNITLLLISERVLNGAMDLFLTEELITEVFARVHASNMSKLDDEGRPIFNEAGKVLKGPNYKKPYLTDLAVEPLMRFVMQSGYEDVADAA